MSIRGQNLVFHSADPLFVCVSAYPINYMRYLSSSEPTVESAEAICLAENVDRRMEVQLLFPESLPATVIVDFALPGWGPLKLIPQWLKIALRVECEQGTVEIWNYPLPSLWHSITVTPNNGNARVEKVYKPMNGRGQEWWSAYVSLTIMRQLICADLLP